MKKVIFIMLLVFPATLLPQYTGGIGGGSAVATLGNSPLPVELNSFTSTFIGSKVILKWETQTETNNFGFEIQRSIQNSVWEEIGFINGYGNSNSRKEYAFTDYPDLSFINNLKYRLKQIDNDGKFEYSQIVEVVLNSPVQFRLSQNYPNPFNPSTVISFQLPSADYVTLKVFNSLGEEVAVLIDKFMDAGSNSIRFKPDVNLGNGVYFYQLRTGRFVETKKMILIK